MTAPILVVGATGQQGGSVVKFLLKKGLQVRGLTRNTASEKAKALTSQGVEMVAGDLSDSKSIVSAAQGVAVAWLVTTPMVQGGPAMEAKNGMDAVDAFKAAKVPHVVFSSVSDAQNKTGIPHFDSKYKVEEHLVASGLAYTITGPVYFTDNTTAVWNLPYLKQGVASLPMPGDIKLQMVSAHDIGRLNAEILSRPQDFIGQRIDYAGDAVTGVELATILTKQSGKRVKFVEGSIEDARKIMGEEGALMFEWFAKTGYSADIDGLAKQFPGMWQSVEGWAKAQDWATLLS